VAEILTQKDLDALILSLTVDDSPGGGSGTEKASKPQHLVRVYDFRRPDKFSRDQIRTVEMLHENIARLTSTYLAAQMRSLVNVVVSSVDQLTFEEFIKLIPNPSHISTITLEPLKGSMFMVIETPIALVMVDRLFGGPGTVIQASRPLTEIEMAIMERLSKGILQQVRESWESLVPVDPKIDATGSNPSFIEGASSNEMTVVVKFDVRLGKALGAITLCIPFVTIEPILPKLSAKNWFTQARREMQQRAGDDMVQKRLGAVEVDVIARLGKADLPVEDILDLGVGDVIQLESRVMDEITVLVEDRVKYKATPGRSGTRLCFRINRVIREDEFNG